MTYRLPDPDAQREAENKPREIAERALERRAAERATDATMAARRAASLQEDTAEAARRRYRESFHWIGWFTLSGIAIAVLMGLSARRDVVAA